MIRTVLAWIGTMSEKASVNTAKGFGTSIGIGLIESAIDAAAIYGVVKVADNAIGKFTNR